MCLAIPGRVSDLPGNGTAILDFIGVAREVTLGLVDDVRVGDFLLVHAGCAIARLEETEAYESLALWEELMRYASSP